MNLILAQRRFLILAATIIAAVIVPILLFSDAREAALATWLELNKPVTGASAFVLASLIILLLSLDIFLPVPSSVVSAVAGQHFGLGWGTILCWTGLNLSSAVGYLLGYWLGFRAVSWFSKPSEVDEIRQYVDRFGLWSIVAFRSLPVLAEASMLFLGTYRFNSLRFWPAVFGSNFVVALVFVGLGKWSADQGYTWLGILLSILIPILLFSAWKFSSRHVKKVETDTIAEKRVVNNDSR